MFRLIPFWAYGVALLAAVGMIWGHGYQTGARHVSEKVEAAARATQEEINKANARAADQERRRLQAEADRDRLARRLTSAAFADPDADRPALSAAAVSRIDQQ